MILKIALPLDSNSRSFAAADLGLAISYSAQCGYRSMICRHINEGVVGSGMGLFLIGGH